MSQFVFSQLTVVAEDRIACLTSVLFFSHVNYFFVHLEFVILGKSGSTSRTQMFSLVEMDRFLVLLQVRFFHTTI